MRVERLVSINCHKSSKFKLKCAIIKDRRAADKAIFKNQAPGKTPGKALPLAAYASEDISNTKLPFTKIPIQRTNQRLRQEAFLALQKKAGNRQVQMLAAEEGTRSSLKKSSPSTTPDKPEESSISSIYDRSKSSGKVALFAGTTSLRAAPDGLAYILQQGSGGSIGVSGGLTLISRTAADFRPPQLSIVYRSVRRGLRVDQYAEIEPTQSADATHPSYYPGPGQHVRPGMTSQQGGQTLTYHWDISPDISDMIRRGEQEHLNDAQRAYDLTYGLIAQEISALAGQRFGPAPSRDLARLMAENALLTRLPPVLGLNPADWWNVLFQMLGMTKSRDDNSWHALNIDPPQRVGNRLLYPVSTTGTTRIDQVGSEAVVNYPSQPPSTTGTPGDFPIPSGQQRRA